MNKQLPVRPLSSREYEVLELLWRGFGLKEIASKLKLTYGRVRQVRLSIGLKLNVSTTWQLARRALELGLIKL